MSTTQLILAFAITFLVGYIVGVLHVYIGTKPPALTRRPSNVTDEQWRRVVANVQRADDDAARNSWHTQPPAFDFADGRRVELRGGRIVVTRNDDDISSHLG